VPRFSCLLYVDCLLPTYRSVLLACSGCAAPPSSAFYGFLYIRSACAFPVFRRVVTTALAAVLHRTPRGRHVAGACA